MLKLRIEFLAEQELEEVVELLEDNYIIYSKGKIKESKNENSKLKFVYIEVVKKQ